MGLIRLALDEDGARASRIVSRENKSENQGLPATEVLTPAAVVGGTEYENDVTSECFRSLLLWLILIWICVSPHQKSTLATLERKRVGQRRHQGVRVDTSVSFAFC